MEVLLVDTGALVALPDRSDALHGWAVEVFKSLRQPLLTCEAVAQWQTGNPADTQ